jgi:hypothetical protein
MATLGPVTTCPKRTVVDPTRARTIRKMAKVNTNEPDYKCSLIRPVWQSWISFV